MHYPDDLTIPFCFIPDGAPEPADWLARYPNHIRMPATFIQDPLRQDDPPMPPVPAATLEAAIAASASLSQWEAPRLSVAVVPEFLAATPCLLILLGLSRPISTAPNEYRPTQR